MNRDDKDRLASRINSVGSSISLTPGSFDNHRVLKAKLLYYILLNHENELESVLLFVGKHRERLERDINVPPPDITDDDRYALVASHVVSMDLSLALREAIRMKKEGLF